MNPPVISCPEPHEERIQASYPLTPLQEGMIFHSLMTGQPGMYLQQFVGDLTEPLVIPAFVRAWQQLVERHPVLRTSVTRQERENSRHRVHESVTIPWDQQDWRGQSPAQQSAALEEYLQADRERGFNWSQPPLFRLALFRLGEARYWFLWTSHHVLLDGRSRFILLEELFSIYEALAADRLCALAPATPFGLFVDWLQGQDGEKAAPFWRQVLAGYDEPTRWDLGDGSRPKGTVKTASAKKSCRLSSAVSEALRSLAVHHGLTLNTLFQGAWAILLSRYTSRRKVLFGATRAGRRSCPPATGSAVGLLINTVPVPVEVDPQVTLLPWLKQLRDYWVAVRPYEHSPLIEIQKCGPIPAGVPMFDTLTVFEDYEVNARLRQKGGAWPHRSFRLHSQTNYPMVVSGFNGPEILLEIEYQTAQLADAVIERILGHLRTLLTGFIHHLDEPLSNLDLLTEAEKRQLLVAWNDTAVGYPSEQSVSQRFEEQVERTPEAVAVEEASSRLTYRELNQRANQLAHHLRGLGVATGTLVGVHLDRSIEFVVGVLGILKAGGAYVPLAPEYPVERRRFMIADTKMPVLITAQPLPASLLLPGLKVVRTDALAGTSLALANPPACAPALSPAYVMYTSGSTGQPKGVLVPHRAILRLVCGTDFVPWGPELRFLLLAPVSFDASTFELWGALLHGSTCAIFAPAHFGLEDFARVMSEHRVSCLWLTAGLFNHIIDHQPQVLRPVRHLLTGGEALSPSHVQRALELLPETRLVNGYGPTEGTTFTCAHAIAPFDAGAGLSSVPIGKPIANTRCYVLDDQRKPVPIGVTGELFIGGDGLALGYLNAPELTAEKFVRNPFGQDPTGQMYRTGDLCRWLANGTLEFIGRADDQVKIRGYRVEPGEIESALAQHPKVRENVVLAQVSSIGLKCLVAYLVTHGGSPLSVSDLRGFLKTRLAEPMIPSAFVFLDQIPLTSNGKVDRQALPLPEFSRDQIDSPFVSAQTPMEVTLTSVWEEILGLSPIGIHDDFFELGGHSLLATRLASRLRQVLDRELPLRILFENPTVAGLAAFLATAQRGITTELRPLVSTTPKPLSFAQQGLWFLNELEPGNTAYHIPWAYRLTGALHVAALERSLSEILRRHEALRTRFASKDGQPIQVILPPEGFILPREDLSALAPEPRELEMGRLVRDHLQQAFDLEKGPLLRVKLIRLGVDDHLLLINLHHIVADGWSLGVFTRELSALYPPGQDGQSDILPSLPVQYADYAVWQRQWLQGAELERQLGYWRKQLADLTTLELPVSRPRPENLTYAGARQPLALSPELTAQLQAFCRAENVTPFMSLLAAFQVLLHRYSGQEDIVVGTPIANRQHTALENLIGFFVNTLVMRGDLSGEPDFRAVVARTRRVALDAYQHQDLPFEKLVEELNPVRDRSRHPLFQVMFAVRNTPDHRLHLAGLAVAPHPLSADTIHFDLELHLWEEAGSWRGSLLYNTDLFEAGTIDRLIGHYQTLLEHLVSEPQCPVSRAIMLPPKEQEQLLAAWNDTAVTYPQDQCAPQLFEEQVERTPDAVAVEDAGSRLTYRELNQRANQWAHHLRQLGVATGTLVGVHLDRSLEFVAGILGILKAGGAYVPLSPEYPVERLRFMIADTKMPVLITAQPLPPSLPQPGLTIVRTDGWASAAFVNTNLPARPTALSPAYVLYTSGSTGLPKGVMIHHGALVNCLRWAQARFPVDPRDVVLQATPSTFDISIIEIFLPLLNGAKLLLARPGGQREPRYLAELIQAQAVTMAQFVPSTLELLVEEPAFASCASLRQVFCGGEAMPLRLMRRFQQRSAAELVNLYGPTETTIWSTFWVCDPRLDGRAPPIGKPIANTQLYVLDANLNPQPIGVPGELFIGGVQVGLGYLNRPELTAEKFIPNPFSTQPQARLYRTGDRCRWLPDGTVEFLGRLDNQAKISGYRVEPGEIEFVLAQHPKVRKTVVLARTNSTGLTHLVAYLVTDGDSPLSVSDLRDFLKTRLAEPLIPSAFVFLAQLPLMPNGKVDRKALPPPELSRENLAAAFVSARTPMEATLTRIWEKILGVSPIGIQDNFFELGGHSLLAMRLVAKLSADLHRNVGVKSLFLHPTIETLADALFSGETAREPSGPGRSSPRVEAPPDRPMEPRPSPFLTIERRPLLSLFAAGKIAPVDAAAIAYLPDDILEQTGLSRDEIIDQWYDGLPSFSSVWEAAWGRLAILRVPRFSSELYNEPKTFVNQIIEALQLAGRIGARAVSLTGLIPSATDYGRAIATARSSQEGVPQITTGHATTVSTVVLAIEKITRLAGRDLRQERIGFLGLGSIGAATLRLLLRYLPHPAQLTLCDLYGKIDPANDRALASELAFSGKLRILASRPHVPEEFYESTLIVGATNVPEVLDVGRLRAGTIIVDDSGPHCFAVPEAIRRWETQQDILFTEGGVLRTPQPFSQLRHLPRSAESALSPALKERWRRHDPYQITGCVLSSLLTACFDDLQPTLGFVTADECLKHCHKLVHLGFEAAAPHCGDYVLSQILVGQFRQRFGKALAGT